MTPGVTAALENRPVITLRTPVQSTQTAVKPAPTSPSPTATQTPVTIPVTVCASTSFNPIAFLPGEIHLLGRTEKDIRVIDPETGLENVFLVPSGQMDAAALSSDGQILALALVNHNIQLIRMSDKKIIRTLTGHIDRITAIKFTPPSDRLVSASVDTWVRIWDSAGKLVSAFQPGGADNFPAEVLGIGISADGSKLGTISSEGPLKIWDLTTNQKIGEFLGSISGGYDGSEVLFSKDGMFMAETLGGGGQISLWSLADGTLLWRGGLFAAAFSPDGRFFTYTDVDEQGNNIIVLLSENGKETIRVLKGHLGTLWKLSFSTDGNMIATTDDSEIRIWRVEDGQLLYRRTNRCPTSTPVPTLSVTP